MIPGYSEDSNVVFVNANEEALTFAHHFCASEHLLLGLIQNERGLAGSSLALFEVTADPVRGYIENMIGSGTVRPSKVMTTPEVRIIIDVARNIAIDKGDSLLRPEYLLLALLTQKYTIAYKIILDMIGQRRVDDLNKHVESQLQYRKKS
jgi:ATP-dependent Clp protease ATP-binding subunit ClpC